MAWGVAMGLLATAGLAAGCGADAAPNEPPELTLDVGSETTVTVGEDILQIQASGRDPEGGALDFTVVDMPERAELQTFSTSALFTWDPIASDVTESEPRRLIFRATDSAGASAERVVSVWIQAGNGAPRFLNGSSELYDTGSDQPLTIEVQVRDDDSNEVELTMPADSAPAGAQFNQHSSHAGDFVWRPSIEQRQKRVHSVVFVADDGTHEPVRHEVTIILKDRSTGGTIDPGGGGGGTSCELPIVHDTIGAQRTIDDYLIEGAFSSAAASTYDTAFIVYTADDPYGAGDPQFESVEMKREGDTIRGAIPNLLLPDGQAATVFYAICAIDDEAPADSEARIVCEPPTIFHSFVAYSPDATGCADDASAGGSFGSANPLANRQWSLHQACAGAADVHAVTLEPGQTGEVYVVYPHGQDVDIAAYDEAEQAIEIFGASACYGLASAELDATGAASATTWYVTVKGDDVPYQVVAFIDGEGANTCADVDLEPNDTADEAVLVFERDAFFDAEVCSADDIDVYAWDMLAGDEVLVDVGFTHADGDVDALLYAPSQWGDVDGLAGFGVAEGLSTDDDEVFLHQADESGIYYLAVFTNDDPNAYSLNVTRSCTDADAFGPDNHSRTDAALITLESHTGLKVCGGTSDWYRRTGFADATILAELVVEQGARASDVSFVAYDESGAEIARGTPGSGTVDLEVTPTSGGQIYFEVSSPYDVAYALTLVQ